MLSLFSSPEKSGIVSVHVAGIVYVAGLLPVTQDLELLGNLVYVCKWILNCSLKVSVD